MATREYAGTRTVSGTRSEASGVITGAGGNAFLLLEIGDFVLLETGDKVVLDGISGSGGDTTVYRSASGTRTTV